MALEYDYTGKAPETPKKEDGGQTYKGANKGQYATEQIAALGGFKSAEVEVNESADKPVTIKSPRMELGN